MPISATMPRSWPCQLQREDGADACRGKRRENRQRVDVALVEHAEHDVHGDQRGQDQPAFVGERRLKRGGRALEPGPESGRQPDPARGFLDGLHRRAQRRAGREIERQRRRWKLALVIDGQRRAGRRHLRDRLKRNRTAVSGRNVDRRYGVRIAPVPRLDFQDDVVLIQLREDRRHLALAERAVQRVVDGLRGDAEARRRVAIDGNVGAQHRRSADRWRHREAPARGAARRATGRSSAPVRAWSGCSRLY